MQAEKQAFGLGLMEEAVKRKAFREMYEVEVKREVRKGEMRPVFGPVTPHFI